MHKTLVVTAALLGAGGQFANAEPAPANLTPAAPTPAAPTPAAPTPAAPTQGQLAAPYGAGPATNNNNNAWGIANTPSGGKAAGSISTIYSPDTDRVPTPGTIVIRLNGRVEVNVSATFSSVDKGQNADGTPNGYKLNPVGVSSYMRLYPGFDGVAANGLRYGASIELRENFGAADRNVVVAGTAGGAANSPSANDSGQTVLVRRAFSYLASDQAGLLRLGQTDGVLGLFDNCIFTSQCWDGGENMLNTDGFTSMGPGALVIPFAWLNQTGAEYGNNKIVYLTPQVYGFDFGVQYAPNMGNTNQMGGLGVGCGQAGPTCINVSSGNDPTRWINQVGAGLRWQHSFDVVDVKAYGFYEAAGKENLTTAAYTAPSPAGSAGTLRYDNLNFYKAGLAVTAFNFTAAVDYIGGAVNGALQMRPTGGVSMNAWLAGLTYGNGPLTLGAQFGIIDSQGAAQLTNTSQRHEYEAAFGGNYKLAPGLALVAYYTYAYRHQGAFNFAQNAVGRTQDVQGQEFVLGTVLTW